MSAIAAELEQELESELAHEHELEQELESELAHEAHEMHEAHEQESEHEQEAEHEAFFNTLAAMADRGGRSQALRRIAMAAARAALRGAARPYPVIEGELEMELEAGPALEIGATAAEREHFAAMMEHMGHAAAEAANEQEAAEHFLPLIPLAAKALPFLAKGAMKLAPKILGRVGPNLARGVGNIARTLFRNRSTRPLLHAVPRIARSTVRVLAQRAARSRPITPRIAARTLARQTARTISNPRILTQTYRRSIGLDRRFHRHTRRVLGRPVGPMVRVAAPTPIRRWVGTRPAGVPAVSYGGIPVATSGGCNCRCTCQPATAGAQIPAFVPAAVPQAAVVQGCPTCGRSL